MDLFTDGIIVTEYAVAGLLLLRFWRRSKDRFFLLFATAFVVMAANRLFQATLRQDPAALEERQVMVYAVRLFAYLMILGAIADKNRAARARPTGPARTDLAGPPG